MSSIEGGEDQQTCSAMPGAFEEESDVSDVDFALKREIPEGMKPRKIAIGTDGEEAAPCRSKHTVRLRKACAMKKRVPKNFVVEIRKRRDWKSKVLKSAFPTTDRRRWMPPTLSFSARLPKWVDRAGN